MTVTILGKRWQLLYRRLPHGGGLCDQPTQPNKAITVDSRLTGENRLRIEIHEMLHAANWHLDEEWVDDASADMARILWKLGYRLEQ